MCWDVLNSARLDRFHHCKSHEEPPHIWRPCFHFSTFVCSLFVPCLFLVSLLRVSGCLQVQNALKAPFKVLFCQPIQGRVLNVKWSPMTSSTLSCTVSWGCQFCGIGWIGSAHFGVWCHMVPPDHIRMIHPYTSQILCDSDRIMNEVNKWMCMWLYVIVQDEIFTYLHHSIPFSIFARRIPRSRIQSLQVS